MTRHDVRIESTSAGGRVYVGGHDLSSAVMSAQFDAVAGQVPVLTLTVPVFTGQVEGREAVVGVPDETAAALQALGWTPPADPPGGP